MNQPFRPPSVPLAVVDPYFSIWSAADRLSDSDTVHWTNKPHRLTGLIRIDGETLRFMGTAAKPGSAEAEYSVIPQKSLNVEPLTTTYVFEGNGVELEVRFTTPLLLDDLDLLSRPVSYIAFQARSVDGSAHQVQICLDISGEWCVNTPDQRVVWSRGEIGSLTYLRMGTEEQPVLKTSGDDRRIDWGYGYLAAVKSDGLSTVIHTHQARAQFAATGRLPETDDSRMPRPVSEDMPIMAAAWDLGEVSDRPVSRFAMLAYDDIHSIEYFGKPLDAYWRRNGLSFDDMLQQAAGDYPAVLDRCAVFNAELIADSRAAGGEAYKDITSLAYRQAIAAHKLVTDEDGNILFFSKENFSNGCIATVDVSYPSTPLFLLYNPELVKGMMRPIFRYANSAEWKFPFAPHDVGTYPKANGQVYGENKLEFQMPIEECGNMLIMAAAVGSRERNADFAAEHWELLTRWAEYLKEHGLDPANQLCTDDFAGHLARNANLSIKAILGIGAYSILCKMLGRPESETYYDLAKTMAAQWVEMARAGDHFQLTFDSGPDSWSMKYNLIWDRLFGLNLFPDTVMQLEIPYYLSKQNRYGLPLDNRNAYTKADWLVWCASMAPDADTFTRMIRPFWDFLNESPSRVPLTDWYDTVSGKQVGFQNRSVVGGLFMKLLADQSESK
jgi:hypothetical protein